jgi:hypothetical protein
VEESDAEAELKIALMNAQLEKTQMEIERLRQDIKWDPWKAFAGVLAGVAAIAGVILAVAHFIRPANAPAPIVIQLPPQAK